MKRYFPLNWFGLIAVAGAVAIQPAAAADRPVLIRDAETEAAMAEFGDPIFSAAGLDPSAVHIYLLRDSRINAFVAGGQNLFLHTGLIRAAEHVDQLIGVIAHETGHIAGGHLPRMKEAQRSASSEQRLFCARWVLGSVVSWHCRRRRERQPLRRWGNGSMWVPRPLRFADEVQPHPGICRRPGGDEIPGCDRPVVPGHGGLPANPRRLAEDLDRTA